MLSLFVAAGFTVEVEVTNMRESNEIVDIFWNEFEKSVTFSPSNMTAILLDEVQRSAACAKCVGC